MKENLAENLSEIFNEKTVKRLTKLNPKEMKKFAVLCDLFLDENFIIENFLMVYNYEDYLSDNKPVLKNIKFELGIRKKKVSIKDT